MARGRGASRHDGKPLRIALSKAYARRIKRCWMDHGPEGSLPFTEYLTLVGMAAYDDWVESGGLEQLKREGKL